MIETIEVEVDGIKFSIQQFPARQSIKLDVRTLKILSPLVSVLEKVESIDTNIDMSVFATSVRDILTSLTDDDFRNYISSMVKNTFATTNPDGQGNRPVQLSDGNVFDMVFAGKNLTVFKLLLEIMKVNGFSFFGLLGGGGINITGIFEKVKKEERK